MIAAVLFRPQVFSFSSSHAETQGHLLGGFHYGDDQVLFPVDFFRINSNCGTIAAVPGVDVPAFVIALGTNVLNNHITLFLILDGGELCVGMRLVTVDNVNVNVFFQSGIIDIMVAGLPFPTAHGVGDNAKVGGAGGEFCFQPLSAIFQFYDFPKVHRVKILASSFIPDVQHGSIHIHMYRVEIIVVDRVVIYRAGFFFGHPFITCVGIYGRIANCINPAVGSSIGAGRSRTVAGVGHPALNILVDGKLNITGLFASSVIVENEFQFRAGFHFNGKAVPSGIGRIFFYCNTGPGAAILVVFKFAPGTAFTNIDGHFFPFRSIVIMNRECVFSCVCFRCQNGAGSHSNQREKHHSCQDNTCQSLEDVLFHCYSPLLFLDI